MSQAATISPESRKAELLKVLEREGECTIDALADRFTVSGMTIRRDLQDLADDGQVIRTHGGATLARRISFEFRFLERTQEHAREKALIADLAASFVEPGQSVLLDSGTTTLAIAQRLPAVGPLTVVTTSLPIASQLFGRPQIEVVLLGGTLRHDAPDLTGALTDSSLELVRTDIAFLGADAIDAEGWLYNQSEDVGRLLKRMAKASDRVFAVADHSKVGRHELMRFGRLRDWDGLITDRWLDRDLIHQLRRHGGSVMMAGKGQRRG